MSSAAAILLPSFRERRQPSIFVSVVVVPFDWLDRASTRRSARLAAPSCTNEPTHTSCMRAHANNNKEATGKKTRRASPTSSSRIILPCMVVLLCIPKGRRRGWDRTNTRGSLSLRRSATAVISWLVVVVVAVLLGDSDGGCIDIDDSYRSYVLPIVLFCHHHHQVVVR